MDTLEKLELSGLTRNESKVYLELLKREEIGANQISKNLGMDRTLVYTVLNHLIEKGQANYIIRDGKKLFSNSNVDNLLSQTKSREMAIVELIASLKKLEKKESLDTKVEIYEGKEGLRSIMRLMMKYKDLCSFGATGRAYDYLYESEALAKEWIKSKGNVKLITNSKYKGHDMTKIKYIKTKYLDIESESTTSIFGDYIAIHISIEKPLIILIKNKYISQSYKNHFEVLWKSAKA